MKYPKFLYGLYENLTARKLIESSVPRHVGVILDGNRRWAKSFGEPAAHGHQRGAEKIEDFLRWSEEFGVEVVTLWMLSTDNLRRESTELTALFDIIEDAVRHLANTKRWRLRVVGQLDLLPDKLSSNLRELQAQTANVKGLEVNVAIGYGGRHEIADAVKDLMTEYELEGKTLHQAIDAISVESIGAHLYTKGQPDPELLIRTSGEQRLGGFLLWQSAHSEFYFCEAFWPDFRRVDYLRAIRAYGLRERRQGR